MFTLFVYYLGYLQDIFPFFFFNDTATTEIYTLSLHDALPISAHRRRRRIRPMRGIRNQNLLPRIPHGTNRSEEHTSELQSHLNLVCRLLLEKKKNNTCRRAQSATSSNASRCRPAADIAAQR